MFGGIFGAGRGASFEAHYRAMPVAFIDKQQAEFGDKVILPPSALDRLASLHIEYPMLFRVSSMASGRSTHCGVLEFVAEEGVIYMPHWMMQNLLLEVGQTVHLKNVSLPKGEFVKLQPHTSDFLDISNPKAVLERTLRAYTCLTVGDVFVVHYNAKNYEIEVREAAPAPAISVVETDCRVEFEAPKDYKEPDYKAIAAANAAAQAAAKGPEPMQEDSKAGAAGGASTSGAAPAEPEQPQFLAFAGTARRLDGKPITTPSQPVAVPLPASSSATALLAASAGTSKAGTTPPAAGGSSGGAKAGTFVSTGNRLLDKLQRDKMAAAGHAAPAPAAPKPDDKKEEEDKQPKFNAFAGKGYSLKG
mmetsp:Transcript_35292/g.89326  ORF Transcript_35292/g.89326 Transcript_35292/m.89326 type:complete len:361 (-) Transcript_35292:412-1494(-)|eukprot:CAMPEP_0202864154 /NCGR_PEP_ID=MMETSP1391-20130828/4510_1 /ASSEMBLY_ACC=CAM_ASM_000867 /TAXON_ID=1034604 /ORGANISM="Chlamydomonas leiostraca, Strain SAG 11-49" /LENGTH=360 /DNA_ID=CAMNT_0049543867 /DNA_START=37 /DNA_END=1119 /DNA_ORIENTATION=-